LKTHAVQIDWRVCFYKLVAVALSYNILTHVAARTSPLFIMLPLPVHSAQGNWFREMN